MPDGEGRRLRAPTIHWVWRAFNLQPHRTEISELSADPVFVEKVRDIVGLDLSPPERAVVLCVDEKVKSKLSTDLSGFSPSGQDKV